MMRSALLGMILSAAFVTVATGAQAQNTDPGGDTTLIMSALPDPVDELGDMAIPRFTGRTLPPAHWAVEALNRAGDLLLLPDWLPTQRAVPLEIIEAGLREAMRAAGERNPGLESVTKAWYARLINEFTNLAGEGAEATPRLIQSTAGVSASLSEGAAGPGLGEFEPHRTGALPIPDRRSVTGTAELAASWSRYVSIAGDFSADSEELRIVRIEGAVGAGKWRGSVGRGEVGYGHGVGGGVALSGNIPIDAVQLSTRDAVRLPGPLGTLGRATFHTFLSRLDETRHADRPYLWGASARIQPNRRLTLGVNRAAMFGGDEDITLGRLGSMLIGRVKGVGFENQIVTVSGRLVLPTERVMPVVLHLEWGAEDAAGSWWAVPGIVAGLSVPSIPGVPSLAVAAEYAHFDTSCCSNPSWYRHWSFHGGWASGDQTLGHPLGGNGEEFTLDGTLDLAGGRVKGQLYRRDRGFENLFAPERLGVSYGLATGIEWTPRPSWQFRLEADHEAGRSWSESTVRIGINHF